MVVIRRGAYLIFLAKRGTKGRRRLFEGGINMSINAQLFFRHSLDAKTAKKAVSLQFGGSKPIRNEQKISLNE